MSRIIKGVRFPNDDAVKTFGYLALFSEGDLRKHATLFPKTHCVRVITAPWKRWQSCPIYANREVRDGLQLHDFEGGYKVYEWFKTESEAVRTVKKALLMTHEHDMRDFGGRIHPFNVEYAKLPYYSAVEIVTPKLIWNYSTGLDELRALEDPRVIIGDSKSLDAFTKGVLGL